MTVPVNERGEPLGLPTSAESDELLQGERIVGMFGGIEAHADTCGCDPCAEFWGSMRHHGVGHWGDGDGL
jgi:hypothetical protein